MSAIARYFNSLGVKVSGYDKTRTVLTDALTKEGIAVVFEDSIEAIPLEILENPADTLFVYTPAIPADHLQWNYIQKQGWQSLKRSEVLGQISHNTFCIAVAGTHGKTTTSTLIAHMLYKCNINFAAFLGGISSNYNSNFIEKKDGIDLFEDRKILVLEADEFDRSFHRLNPDIAIITAIDPDHLDIYETENAFYEAFAEFGNRVNAKGKVLLNSRINTDTFKNIHTYTYGLDAVKPVNFQAKFVGIRDGHFKFSYHSVLDNEEVQIERQIENLTAGLPGFHNIENAVAAIAVCLDLLHLDIYDIKAAVKDYLGVKRRFEYVVKNERGIVIDDYAHHPEEIKAIVRSVKELYPEKRLTVIFQPHLFSRTRDFASGFAKELAAADELILMEIYPAREIPIDGINSDWLLKQIQMEQKYLMSELKVLEYIKDSVPELLLILGAGDIDRLPVKIKEIYGEHQKLD